MKAIVLNQFGDTSNFKVANLPIPCIKAHEVLVQIKAAAFNPIDYQMRKGLRESHLMHSPVLGREFSGTVVGTGPKTRRFKPGDHVIALSGSMGSNGTYTQYIALDERLLAAKPANISFEEAAAIPSSGLTAWECFSRAGIQPQHSIFITGATGGVGRFFVKLLKLHGINHIVATAGSPESAKALTAAGIESQAIINYNHLAPEVAILAANQNNRFNYVADLAGGRISEIAARVLKTNGHYLDVTFLGTDETRSTLFDRAANIHNIAAYAHGLAGNLNWYGNTLTAISELIATQQIIPPNIKPVGKLSLGAVQEAHHLMETNQLFGKKLVMSV